VFQAGKCQDKVIAHKTFNLNYSVHLRHKSEWINQKAANT